MTYVFCKDFILNGDLNQQKLSKSKWKALADYNIRVAQIKKAVLDRLENVVVKEENAGYQH